MPYLITRKKTKATFKPWFSRLLRHPDRKRSGSILGHTHTPEPHWGDCVQVSDAWLRDYKNRPTQFPGCMDVMQKAEKATNLLRLRSSCPFWNTGRRVVSIWHVTGNTSSLIMNATATAGHPFLVQLHHECHCH